MKRAAIALAVATAACGTAPAPVKVHAGHPAVAHENPHVNPVPERPHTSQESAADYIVPSPREIRARGSRSRPRPVAPVRTSPPAGGGDVWAALAQCESGMRQDAVGEGVHFSYFQWKLATWRSVKAADDPADPRDASYEAQVAAAKRLQAQYGWGQWPACSRKIGVR